MASTDSPLINGHSMPSPGLQQYADFYEKLSILQQEVYTGRHSRIRLPESVVARLMQHTVQNVPSTSVPVANGDTNVSIYTTRSPTSQDPAAILFPPYSTEKALVPPPIPSAKRQLSELDPIFLTKSDDLVRAETQLRRQRIERSLKDLYDAKKGLPRDKDFPYDSEIRFDVDEILAKALALVEPVSGFDDPEPSDSFDEDSYYSSKANSWSTDEQAASGWKDDHTIQSIATKGKAGLIVEETQRGMPDTQAEDIDPDDDDEYEPTADLEMIEPEYEPELSGAHHSEDDDYSPPPADLNSSRAPNGHVPSIPVNTSARNARRSRTPEPVPVFRNQITSPIAPQPSRISPLATAKQPRGTRNRNNQHGQQNKSRPGSPAGHENGGPSRQNKQGNGNFKSPRNTGQQSPNVPKNGIQNPRKRRREEQAEKQAEKRRNSGKRVARSPPVLEPVIKEEPVSPPPIARLSDPQPLRRRLHEYPSDLEIIQPRELVRPVYYRDVESRQAQRAYEVDEPTTPIQTVARVPSTSSHRRILERDDQDLRRVASLQYARRQSPPADGRSSRAVSHAFVEPSLQPVYRTASTRPTPSQYIRDRSRSPIYVEDAYAGAMRPPPAPAPRPFIVDEYGNKYYAALPERSRVVERSSTREPMLRASVRPVDTYDDEEVVRMPPPVRRYIEHAEPERQYRVREFSTARDDPSRQPIAMYEDMPPPPQAYVSRAYSMRPEVVHREPGVEYVTRHQSIAPGRDFPGRGASVAQGYREVSVMRESRHHEEGVRHITYQAPTSQRRYVDEGEEDLYGEPSRRVVYR
ncbi:hypothetical protein EJ05DRAFT_474486 [Pseudovirgaria hyperparasitica]|uniref:Uncharacterized protein n=1 Tax=Pseudovirgaria hyperparasitica TaxID=470096 RepID=A0A6A6WF70_9PEZI|nr:uncharacterized protein EJ05DRAFT_474486 [Pseudovirgaria hyperparasitica]KAF2760630.1 hypothetical protein EJ05DRAFT_474486 [Pseudovirgaria hyperparasitica]